MGTSKTGTEMGVEYETGKEVLVEIGSITEEVCCEARFSFNKAHSSKGFTSKSDRHERSRSPGHNGRAHSKTPPPRGARPERRDERRHLRSGEFERQMNGTSDRKPSHVRDEETDADVDMKTVHEDTEDIEVIMQKTMGFSRFRSTQNTKVPGNNIYGVRKEKKTQYRQYMNRSGGFNRPLSPTR
jgi:U4/U6.U5 tri-snRNP-associated protein 3